MSDITVRWPPQGWAAFQADDDLHVVPVIGDDPQEPAAGHTLARSCWCRPTPKPVTDGPMPLDDHCIWSHHEPTWQGADPEVLS